MKKDYSTLLTLLTLLKTNVFIVESKYSDLSFDKIKLYELEKDIDIIERLTSAISFKAEKIIDEMVEQYVNEYYEQESLKFEQEKVIAND